MQTDAPLIATLQAASDRYATPCFVYLQEQIRSRAQALREAFGGRFRLSYAVKSNPNPHLLRAMREVVDTLDVSSGGEVALALQTGWEGDLISFTGPAKTRAELETAVEGRVQDIILESVDEARLLQEICERSDTPQEVLLRIAPTNLPRGFGVNMAGKPTQFGIDEEVVDEAVSEVRKLDRLGLRGFHIYSGTQCLKAESVAENYENFLAIYRRTCERHDIEPKRLIFGSGLGIPYHEKDEPLDLNTVAAATNPRLDEMRAESRFAGTEFLLELGRYLIGEAGFFLTRVVRMKESRGSTIALCDGGMNHHLGACGHLGSVLHRNYRIFNVTAESEGRGERAPHELVGPLCTSIDTLGHGVILPETRPHDVLAVHCSGAYGLSSSPLHFISHEPPRELLVEGGQGEQAVIRDITHFQPHLAASAVH